ncbi:serine carboxypeptidase [Irpex rosettiformis]|uniref:Serine carboxypeptidase n=1 Tax=Irpex rosettiformis TaxID=378272 RepID=A0ACB8TY54_9APHY|nr:serine carboxypeptidase [Irpex rosettiformis]
MMFSLIPSALGLLTASFLVVSAHDTQQVFSTFDSRKHDNGHFTPSGDLHSLSATKFTTLGHPLFPNYGVRIKESRFCDGTVKSYTGYIDVEARHLFFYFFESRSDPDKDDVIFWTNGGPGCSSSMGLFMELGPCRVTDPDNSTFNPYSWNEKANVFFIDQPIGVGFSYAEYGEHVSTTEEAAKDVGAFIAIFFEHFIKFKGRAFHMAGESYAGRYIPAFASYIYDQNSKLIAAGATPINLSSIMIGNGCSDDSTIFSAYYDMQCKNGPIPPVQDIRRVQPTSKRTCVSMKRALPRCQKWIKESCYDRTDSIDCVAAYTFCSTNLELPFYTTGINPYDISKPCEGSIDETACYSVTTAIATYLNNPAIRQTIGVDDRFAKWNFTSCNHEVASRFGETLDTVFPSPYYIAALLERGIGVDKMLQLLDWTGKDAFRAADTRQWEVDGRVAGLIQSAERLTFVTIDGAGHMVPYDKPKESLELIGRWLAMSDI